jgi:AcrR family transcriptional regulator
LKEGGDSLGGGMTTPRVIPAVGAEQHGVEPVPGQRVGKPAAVRRIEQSVAGRHDVKSIPRLHRREPPTDQRDLTPPAGEVLAPLYERLPRGPHQMKPREVAENQRIRMHGAMVEAVAANGYGRTSVKQVVALAGVSRRAFYEQFANKQECFLATLDLIASRALEEISETYRSAEGDLEQRFGATLEAMTRMVQENPKSAHVIMIDAPSAGPGGWMRLTEMLTAFEVLVAKSFAHDSDAAPLPTPVVRGIVGGLRRMTLARLRAQRTEELSGMVGAMLSWTLAFKARESGRLATLARRSVHGDDQAPAIGKTTDSPPPDHERALGRRSVARRDAAVIQLLREHPALNTTAGTPAALGADDRTRLLIRALELAELEGYGNVTPLRIADEAGVSIDIFFELFDDMQECFLEAIAEVGEELRETLLDPGLASTREWPAAVRRTLYALMCRLAIRPAYGHAIATGVFTMGDRAVELTAEIARDVVAALVEGAPGPPREELTREGIEGAIWHTIYHQAMSGRTDLLPRLSDYLAYIVLTPFLGPEEAARIVTADSAHQHAL